MNCTMFQEAMEQAGLPVEVDAFSVYRAFEQIPDGRQDPAWDLRACGS